MPFNLSEEEKYKFRHEFGEILRYGLSDLKKIVEPYLDKEKLKNDQGDINKALEKFVSLLEQDTVERVIRLMEDKREKIFRIHGEEEE